MDALAQPALTGAEQTGSRPPRNPRPWDARRVEQRLLGSRNRRRIVEHVRAHPGIHLRQLARDLGLAIGTTEHHLHVLAQHGVLEPCGVRNRTAYFARDGPSPELRGLLAILRNPQQRRLLVALAADPELDAPGLALRLGVPRPSISYHVQRLVRLGVLEELRIGRSRLVRVADPQLVALALAAQGSRSARAMPGCAPGPRARRQRPSTGHVA